MPFPLGEVASLGAASCWATGLTLFRRPVREVGAPAVNLFKGMVGTALTVATVALAGAPAIGARAQVMLMVSGVVGICIGDTLLFCALARLGAHRTALMQSLGPVLTATGGWFLGEPLLAQRLFGIACTTGGVAAVVYFRPHGPERAPVDRTGLLFGVAAAACQSGGVLLAKQGMREADPMAASALRLSASTAVLALAWLVRGRLRVDLVRLVRARHLARTLPAAFIGTYLALWLMQVGIKHAESAVANALHSTTPLFTLPIALFVLRERFGGRAILGSLAAVGGVALLLLA